jgi:hypothetical protein
MSLRNKKYILFSFNCSFRLQEMYFLNGRVTSLKRLFSLDIHSAIGKQNFHLNILNLDKTNNKNKHIKRTASNLDKLKNFTFVEFVPDTVNRKQPQLIKSQQTEPVEKITKAPIVTSTAAAVAESAVEKLARILNLDTSKPNLFEPIESLNKEPTEAKPRKNDINKNILSRSDTPSSTPAIKDKKVKARETSKTVNDSTDDRIKYIRSLVFNWSIFCELISLFQTNQERDSGRQAKICVTRKQKELF